jgi:predicted outer membrane repeat protein
VLSNNKAHFGGAVFIQDSVNLSLRNVTLMSNYGGCGGALSTSSSLPVVMQDRVVFAHNHALNGGAICVQNDIAHADIKECMQQLGQHPFMIRTESNADVRFEANSASWGGGALYLKCRNPGTATMVSELSLIDIVILLL